MAESVGRKIAARLGLGGMLRDWDTVAALMESEADACALTSDGGVVYMNRAAKAFFGNKPLFQAVLDRTTNEESNVLALAKLEAAVKNGADTSVELAMRALRSDMTEWYRVAVRQIGVGTLWRVADISAQRSLDAVIRQEIQELGEFLDILTAHLRK